MPWVALDATMMSGTDKSGIPGDNTSSDYSISTVGAVVGVDLPVLFRAWAGYGIQNNVTMKGTSGNPDIKFQGSYAKVGVGVRAIPLLSVNLEYIMNTYSKVDFGLGTGSEDSSTYYDTLKSNLTVLSISCPFNF